MWFGLLGPLQVCDGPAAIDIPGARSRVLLSGLLLRAGQTVDADTLAELVWDGSPPGGARGTLRSHVMRLRRALGPAAGRLLVTRYPGYLIEAEPDDVDVLRFAALCRQGGAAARQAEWEQAAAVLRPALGLWRGEALADVPSQALRQQEVPRLEQARLQAREWLGDADLHLGRPAELIPELQELVARYPLRERFHAQLMLALAQAGRRAEGLAAYRAARLALTSELGVEPGPELRRLHQRMLAADGDLAVPAPPPAERAQAPAGPPAARRVGHLVPRQLPPGVRHFTGRQAELAALDDLLAPAGTAAGGVTVSVIVGMAGAGKSALAVHWAREAAGQFPDGQLYVNLRGYDADAPVPAADALAVFLRALGVAGPDIPAGADERAAMYRSLLAGRRLLLLLDNAGTADQVRPLLPGAPGRAVVTSRDSLAGLVARDGAARLRLDLLPAAEATGLLAALIGRRADDDPEMTATLAAQCGRLPLALRVAAELASSRPAAALAELARELGDHQRLDLLAAGDDPGTSVRGVFSWSVRHLEPGPARLLALLGLHPGPDLDRYAAAALADLPARQAGAQLDVLARAHLVQVNAAGRYSQHDLLHDYSRELAADQQDHAGRRAAVTRLLDYYLQAAAAAVDVFMPAERYLRPAAGRLTARRPARLAPPIPDLAAARAWLDAERTVLVAAADHAARHGWPEHVGALAATLDSYLTAGGYFPQAIAVHSLALRTARQAGDRAAEAAALANLGLVDASQGRGEQAGRRLAEALALYQATPDRSGTARVLIGLGVLASRLGRLDEAGARYEQAANEAALAGDWYTQASAFISLSGLSITLGRYERAGDLGRRALAFFREVGDRTGEGYALNIVGNVEEKLGDDRAAERSYRRSLELQREVGERVGQGFALTSLGSLLSRLGRHREAIDYQRQALAVVRESGERFLEAPALICLGSALLGAGEAGQARAQYLEALSIATEARNPRQQARAHDGLAAISRNAGDLTAARRHWQEALSRYDDIGLPEAADVRKSLAALAGR
jgi:DNA-binding SARP family transcriptional activator/Tfp pilus assembly protein PilF